MQKIKKSTNLRTIRNLAPPCSCEACSHGCTMGSGLLVEGDAKKIAKFLGITVKELKDDHLEQVELFNKRLLRPKIKRKGKPYGECKFLKNKKCTIHSVKPLQCKISMGCRPYSSDLTAWFMLNKMMNVNDPEAVRQYADYLGAGGHVIPGGKLEELVPDKKMLKKILTFRVLK